MSCWNNEKITAVQLRDGTPTPSVIYTFSRYSTTETKLGHSRLSTILSHIITIILVTVFIVILVTAFIVVVQVSVFSTGRDLIHIYI
jgi:hypothetical protein